jgi:CHAT domain-containing protein/tetratricopeptide (TPR) repeat protein
MRSQFLAARYRGRIGLSYFILGLFLCATLAGIPYVSLIQSVKAQSSRIEAKGALLAASSFQQGLSFYQEGNFVKAIYQWEQDALIFRQKDQWLDEALTLNYLALAYQDLGQYEKAQVSVNHGLQKFVRTEEQPKNTLAVLARLFNTQGSLHLTQGKSQLALESWQKAAQTYRQLSDRTGETGALINQAQAEQALGYFLRARNTLDQAERMISDQSDISLRLPLNLSLGQVLTHIGEFKRAETVLSDALRVARHQKSPHSVTALLIQQGNLAHAQQKFEAALQYYRQALEISDRPQTRIEIELNCFRVLLEQKNWDAAQALWPNLKTVLESLPVNHSTLFQRLQLADGLILLQSTLHKTAALDIAQLLTQTIQQAKQRQDSSAESFALGYMGQLYERNQQWAEAEAVTRKAFALAQINQSPESKYRWEWQLGRIARSQGKIAPALLFYQGAVETLQSMRQNLVSLSPDLQYSFRNQVEPVYREYVELLLQPSSAQFPAQNQLKQAQQVIEAFRVAELDYFLRSACLENHQYSLDQWIEKNTAILYPIVLRDHLATLVNLPDGSLHLFTQPITASALETTIQKLRDALEKPYTAPEGKVLGTQLHRWLVEPAQKLLAKNQIKTLVFVPDGALRNIPLAALYDGKRFLIEQYRVAIAPSLKLLAPTTPLTSPLKTLAAGLSQERNGFGPLPFVSDELKAVARNGSGKVLLNEQFTRQAIANTVNESSVNTVHFATHGRFSSNVDQTFIMAWDKPITLYELKDLLEPQQQLFGNSIDLLVLSACETATGDNQAALGLAGIAVQAGIPSTMATLWNVDDESSSVFMEAFYKNLSQPGITKAEALRQTQLRFLKDRDYRHPLHWAAYVLVGNWL